MRRGSILLFVILLFAQSLPCFAQLLNSSWPEFRHDSAHSACSDSIGPASASLAWSKQIGAGNSSPAVGTDAIYIVANGNLVALSLNGEQLWSFDCNNTGRSSPAISSTGVIYIASTDSTLYAINSDGSLKWKKALPGPSNASPTIGTDGIVYIGCYVSSTAGRFQAYSSDGILKINYTTPKQIASSAAVASDGTIYFGCDDGYLYALSSSGALKWKFQTNPLGAIQSSPAISADESTVYFGTSYGYFYAVSSAGVKKWRYSCDVVYSSPAIGSDGTIYFGCQNNSIYALKKIGSLKWKYNANSSIYSSPAIDSNGVIYAGTEDGFVYAIDSNGNKLWSYQASGSVLSSPAIGPSGTMYFTSMDGYIYCLGADSTSPSTPLVTDDGVYSSSVSTLHASWSSSDSESGIAYYEYAIGTKPGAVDIIPFTNVGINKSVTCTDLNLINGATYYFTVRAANGVGLVSEVGISDGIIVDYTAPSIPIVKDGGAYISNAVLSATWLSSDFQSGIVSYEYAIGSSVGAEDVVGYTNVGIATSITRSDINLQNGKNYYFNIRAINGAGLISECGYSDGVLYDKTPPDKPVITDDGVYNSSSSTLHASWSSSDFESGIAYYEYAIGTKAGAADVVPFTDIGATKLVTCNNLDLVNGATYYFTVRATNGAGLVSEAGISNGVIVDYTTPTIPTVKDEGIYTSTSVLSAAWSSSDLQSGIVSYEYAIGTIPGINDIVGYTNVGTATSVMRPDISLKSGKTYYFNVRATNGAGLISECGFSDGILYDATPPDVPVITDDGKYSTQETTLHARWSSIDLESGVSYYEYAIGTGTGLTDLVPFTNVGAATEITRTDLTLVNGIEYYFTVRAINNAGLVSAEGYSDGITVDFTPPATPVVIDDGKYTSVSDSLHFVYDSGDIESGTEYYEYSIGTAVGLTDVLDWQNAARIKEQIVTGLDLKQNTTYYINVRAYNYAGLMSQGSSNGILVDLTSPLSPKVTDDGSYSCNLTTLHAEWSSNDLESDIAGYSYCIGSAVGLGNIVDWTNTTQTNVTLSTLNLINGGNYYFSVKVTNRAGLESKVGTSDGITIDTTAPSTPVVTDDGETTSISNSLHVAYTSFDDQSGIIEYSYCIGTSSGADDILAWTSADTATSVVANNLLLEVGVNYYFSVKAKNGAGIWSDIGTSNGIQLASVGAVWPKFRYDSSNIGRCSVNACTTGNVQWCVQTQGFIESSAAIAGDGTVYVGSNDGNLYAINANGSIRWTYAMGAVDSSPAIGADGEIYIGSYDGNFYCILPNGKLKWIYTTGDMIWSSPNIASDGTIYFGCENGFVYALNSDGTLKWKYNAGGAVWSSPAIGLDGSIYFACGDSKFYALNADGSLKWTYLTGTAADSSPSIAADTGVIYFGSGDGYFYAINPDGKLRWHAYTGTLVDSSAAIASNGTIYVGTGGVGLAGSMRAFSSEGKELWRINLEGSVKSSPAIDGNSNIYFGTTDGKFYAVDSSGKELWIYDIGQSIMSSPAIGPNGQVIIGSDNGVLYCFKDDPSSSSIPIGSIKGTAKAGVNLFDKIVTAVFDDSVFIEESDRSSGIRCIPGSSKLKIGALVDAIGNIVNQNGEIVLQNAVLSSGGLAPKAIKPVGMSIKDIAGIVDTNNLLVRVSGRVTSIDTDYFILSDGSNVISPRGVKGIEVRINKTSMPSIGSFVSVTGVICVELINATPTKVIRAVSGLHTIVTP